MSSLTNEARPAETPASMLTRDFLGWLDCRPRSYVEAMEAWRSSCPRLSIWEDALADGLISVDRGSGAAQSRALVIITARGRAILDGA